MTPARRLAGIRQGTTPRRKTMVDDSRVVIAFFDSEEAADQAAADLKAWGEASEEIKLDNVGVLVRDAYGVVKEHKLGPRSGKKGAGIGLVLGLVAAVPTAGLSLVGGAVGGAVGGGILGAVFHKGLPKEDLNRVTAEIGEGHAAVGVLVDASEADQVTAKLVELGGRPEVHEVSDEGLQQAAVAQDEGGQTPTTPSSAETATAQPPSANTPRNGSPT
jgi:uncharacterized membrane protein